MVLKNISLNKTKKAYAYTQILLIIGSLIIIFVILFLASSSVSTIKTEYEEITPELSYEFPTVYVNTFLNTPLTEKDINNFSNLNLRQVKDLIFINSDKSKDLIKKYKKEFNDKYSQEDSRGKSIHDFYKKFSNDEYDENTLLVIYFDKTKGDLPNLDNLIENKDYAFFMLTKTGSYTIIYFKDSKTKNILNSVSNAKALN